MAIKILIGGSPCTYWSIAQTNNRETKAEGIGWELFKNYLIAKEKFKPDFFLYENNKSASQAIKDQIAQELGVGVDPMARFTYINSALVSAQNRQRFYVTNFGEIEQPEDRGILLKDILETGTDLTQNRKSYCVTANYDGAAAWNTIERNQQNMVAEPVKHGNPRYLLKNFKTNEEKSNTLTASSYKGIGSDGMITVAEPVNAHYSNNYGGFEHRMFSPNPAKQQVDMIAEPINTTEEGKKARTIMAGYYKYGTATLLTNDGFKGGTTAVAEPVNTTSDGKSQTIKAQYQRTSARNICCYKSTYGATGVAEPIQVGSLPRPNGELSTSQAMRIYAQDGKNITQSAGGGGLGGKTGLYAIPVEFDSLSEEYYHGGHDSSLIGMVETPMTGRNGKQPSQHCRVYSCESKSSCLDRDPRKRVMTPMASYATPCERDENGIPTKAVSGVDGKTYTVYKVENGLITIKEKEYPIKLQDGYYIIRKLTVRECARLQTMPDDYCKAVSDSQAYKALGNGWTAEVIIHLLNHALKDVPRDEEIIVLSMYDGIATGRYCLDKMGFTNVTYHAYEIDKYPIQIALDNYPDIIEHGDAFAVREDDWKAPQPRTEWLDELLGGD